MARRRIGYFDVARAVAIIMVIVGHTAVRFQPWGYGSTFLLGLAFSFQLPLFFVLSGYFLHVDRPFDLGKELRALVLPYAVTALLVVAGICASNLLLHDLGDMRSLFWGWANAAVFGASGVMPNALWPQTQRIGALWFLLALFWARLVVTLTGRSRWGWLWAVASFLVGWWSARYVFLPFDVQPGLCAVPYVYLGHWLRARKSLENGRIPLWGWVLLACIWMYAIDHYTGLGMGVCQFGDRPTSFVRNVAGGAAGSLCVMGACESLERRGAKGGLWQLMVRVGQITLPIMCVHLFEDDVVRWDVIVQSLSLTPYCNLTWLLVMVARVAADILIAWTLLKIPTVAAVFGGSAARTSS